MLKRILWLLLILAATAQALTDDTAALRDLAPAAKQGQTAHIVSLILDKAHYRPKPLDDALSEVIFDNYLKALDNSRMFFTQADIDQFSPLRDTLDDAIINENLRDPYLIFNRYLARASQRFAYARSLLKNGFDFSQNETYQYRRDKAPWPQSEAEVNDLWRKRVKEDWLRLRLAGKSDASIAETLDKRYANYDKRLRKLTNEDAFQIFMNSYTMALEPHTSYMAPRAAEDFDISMRLSLVGIGAVLSEKDDFTVIRELIPGGPAATSGQLAVGDRIVGVAQGKNAPMTDVLGWRLDDTVALIRGAADTVVVLDILPAGAGPDAKHKLVPLTRHKIALEEQAAKKTLVEVGSNGSKRKIGVITLPSFYDDFEGRMNGTSDFRSTTRDVARLINELKAEKADALLIDLRNNGGGSLNEAIELTGLFVGKGPVLQQRSAGGKVEGLKNTKSEKIWDGPLGVLINRGSASASEIFAAAIQDYGRGIVIGEPSFGKGTVQKITNIDDIVRRLERKSDTAAKPVYGELKFTVAQFFRINGGTTQLRGVTPDIVFPLPADPDDFGESSFPNALPWVQIAPADYKPFNAVAGWLPRLTALSEAREKTDRDFICLKDSAAEVSRIAKQDAISLNETERRKEIAAQDQRLATCESTKGASGKARDAKSAFKDDGLQADERALTDDLEEKKALNEAKDALLDEATRILGDAANLAAPEEAIATRDSKATAPRKRL